MKDEDVDFSDIPLTVDWSKAVVGKFYRPAKKPVSIRLDDDVLAWVKRQGPGHQARINALLRNAMETTDGRRFVAQITEYGEYAA